MYSSPELIIKYLRHYFKAANSKGHGTHSPFVFEFITKVLNDNNAYPAYTVIENERRHLRKNQSLLQVTDFGAGSKFSSTNKRKVSHIARHALKSSKYAALFFRMVKYFQPNTIVELGTSLGITTSYLAMASPSAKVITFEGSDQVAATAAIIFKNLKINNIKQVIGNFDDTLGSFLKEAVKIDFVFIDGNHRYQPTINYFEQLLSFADEYTIIVLDDVHWSAEMERAWDYCRTHPAVRLSIDLFFIGILFFRKDFRVPQHFSIRF